MGFEEGYWAFGLGVGVGAVFAAVQPMLLILGLIERFEPDK